MEVMHLRVRVSYMEVMTYASNMKLRGSRGSRLKVRLGAGG